VTGVRPASFCIPGFDSQKSPAQPQQEIPILSIPPQKAEVLPLQADRDFAGCQILGSREEQQDSYAFSIVAGNENRADMLLVLIADGMGGHVGGREASLAAVRGFVEAFFEAFDAPAGAPAAASRISDCEIPCGPTRCPGGEISREASALKTALLAANQAVDTMIATDPDTLGEAGTTLVAAVVGRGFVRWISVGDSPLLLWREGRLIRLNADHSMRAVFAEKVAAGQMREGDVANHPERNALFSALTGLEIPLVDEPAEPSPLAPGDMVIAASDGLLTLTDEEISNELSRLRDAPAIEIVRGLRAKVKEKAIPKQDNATIVVVRT